MDSAVTVEPAKQSSVNLFADLFWSVLVEPLKTIDTLLVDEHAHTDPRYLNGAIFIVVLASLSNVVVRLSMAHGSAEPWLYLGYFISDIVQWLYFASMLYVVMKLLPRRTATYRNLLVVSAWTGLPLVLGAPFACLGFAKHAFPLIALIVGVPDLWFCILQFTLIRVCFNLTRFQMSLAIFFLLPAVVVTELFWSLLLGATLLFTLVKAHS